MVTTWAEFSHKGTPAKPSAAITWSSQAQPANAGKNHHQYSHHPNHQQTVPDHQMQRLPQATLCTAKQTARTNTKIGTAGGSSAVIPVVSNSSNSSSSSIWSCVGAAAGGAGATGVDISPAEIRKRTSGGHVCALWQKTKPEEKSCRDNKSFVHLKH
jgi:hypothetical protein